MKILLDTNIIIHREANRVINQEIGQLFNWIDRLQYKKFIHSITLEELRRYSDSETVESMNIKIDSYNLLKTEAPIHPKIQKISEIFDKTDNDINDSKLLNELINDRVDLLITEDKNIHNKALELGLSKKVFKIDDFLNKVIYENPELIDYKVLSVRRQYFGNINFKDDFFDSFRNDYKEFDKWFSKKSNEFAYICQYENKLRAFLYLKVEDEKENYNNISPRLQPKKRLKIGTFKVTLLGLHLGERFLKIVFDNALKKQVDEIYITLFDNQPSQFLLLGLLKQYGFVNYGYKETINGKELVLVRDFRRKFNPDNPRKSFPFIAKNNNVYFVSIYPEYHTELFPDSILRTESPIDFIENMPHRNAIRKLYISHSFERNIKKGDIIVFYRTGGIYKGVVTTIGIVESIFNNIKNESNFINICQKQERTVLTEKKLKSFWNRFPKLKPFVVNLLYSYSLPNRINLKRLIELGIIQDVNHIPRGFGKISWENLLLILKESNSDGSIIGN